jgi:hypothetical protein
MDEVTLTRDGSIVHGGKTVEGDPLMVLGFKLNLEEGCTLRSYFEAITKYPVLGKLNSFLSTCIKQYHASPGSGCVPEDVECLELSKTVEMIGYPGKPRLEIYISFRGVCGNQHVDIRSKQMEHLLDVPIRLGRLRHIIFGDKVDIFEFDSVVTLFEFIDGISWDLSFHGMPVQCPLRR